MKQKEGIHREEEKKGKETEAEEQKN